MIAVARAAQECSTNLDGWQAVAIVVVVSSALVLPLDVLGERRER